MSQTQLKASCFGPLHFNEILVAVLPIYCFFYVCQDFVIRETGRDGSALWVTRSQNRWTPL